MMRSAAVALVAIVAWSATIGWPVIALFVSGSTGEPTPTAGEATATLQPVGVLWLRSILWSTGIAIIAMLVGWGPARLLAARLRSGRGAILFALVLLPILLPSYAVFYAWWQTWPADSGVYRWLASIGGIGTARNVTLGIALVAWSWPIACLCTMPVAATWSRQRSDQLQLDGASLVRRFGQRFRHDLGGLLFGGVLVWMLVFANTTCFDLAGIFTVSNEIRALSAFGTSASAMASLAWPALLLAVVGSVLLWWRLALPVMELDDRRVPVARLAWLGFGLLWFMSYALPVVLQWVHLDQVDVGAYFELYGRGLAVAVGRALLVGAVALLPWLLLVRLWSDASRGWRLLGTILALGWIAASFVPGTLLGLGVEAAWNRTGPIGVPRDAVLGTGVALVLGLVARTAIIPVFLARWTVRGEARSLADVRGLDGGHGFPAIFHSMRPRLVLSGLATFAICAALALGDIPLAAMVAPPSREPPLAVSLLNAMHYQRPDTVMLTLAVLLVFGLVAALLIGILAAGLHRRLPGGGRAAMLLVLVLVMVPACSSERDPDAGVEPLPVVDSFGRPGRGPGQFAYPRAMAVDRDAGIVYVVDKTARVQAFTRDGTLDHAWPMPEKENGKPTGVSVGPDGNIYVADTHYFRVLVFDPEGNEVHRFGEYGEEPGQFLLPTDIAFGPGGTLYVSEYGGNDRIQVFNADGSLLRTIGRFGSEPGEFNRPQSLVLNEDGSLLYVADSCNHRIQVLGPDGEVVRIIGSLGREPGQLHYPYDLALLPDGSLLVSEFGSSRVQHFGSDGTWLGAWGLHGWGPTDLNAPWAIDHDGSRVYVLDSGNDRVQVMPLP